MLDVNTNSAYMPAKLAQRLEDFTALVARPINCFFWMGVFPVQNTRLFALERFVAVFAWEGAFHQYGPTSGDALNCRVI